MSSSAIRNEENDAGDSLPQPHAFHQNLPPPFLDKDGVPLVTKFAAHKAKQAVDLAFSIQLTEGLFECHGGDDGEYSDPMETGEEDADDDTNFEEDMEDPLSFPEDAAETLQSLSKRCSRLNTILSSLENLKFNGIPQSVLMDIVLHLFRLLTATVTYKETTDGEPTRKAVLHFENVGTILQFGESNTSTNPAPQSPQGDLEYKLAATEEELAADLAQNFALPSPCRETILLTLLNLLSNKGPLRSVSNAAIYAVGSSGIGSDNNDDDDNPKNRSLLILQWKPLLRMLLRTAPYLNEHAAAGPVTDSNSRTSNIVKRSVQVIRDARHFFEQGVRPPPPSSSAANSPTRHDGEGPDGAGDLGHGAVGCTLSFAHARLLPWNHLALSFSTFEMHGRLLPVGSSPLVEGMDQH